MWMDRWGMTVMKYPNMVASDVKLDLSRLQGEPAGTETRYTVSLDGPISEQWIEFYTRLQADSPVSRRFELDAPKAIVRFSCRTVDGTGQVFEALERLETLVERANQIAAIRRASAPVLRRAVAVLRAN